jgi:hypothetical protein
MYALLLHSKFGEVFPQLSSLLPLPFVDPGAVPADVCVTNLKAGKPEAGLHIGRQSLYMLDDAH